MLRVLVIYSNNSPVPKRFYEILNKKYKVDMYHCTGIYKAVRKMVKDFLQGAGYWCIIGINSTWNFKIFLYYMLYPACRKIFFPYDISNLYSEQRYPLKHSMKRFVAFKIDNKLEEIMLRTSHKIMHKGLRDELEFLPFYDKIKAKPGYLFRNFLESKLIQDYEPDKKLSRKDGEIHLVYAGGLYLKEMPGTDTFWEFFPKITGQGIHLHVFSKQPEEIVERFREIENNDKYFHYEGYRKHEDLIKELVKFDFGINIRGKDNSDEDFLRITVGFSNKYFDYISAKLPVIISDNIRAAREFIIKYNFGLIIVYEQIFQLKDIIEKNKKYYTHYLKNIHKYIQANRNSKELINFINR